MFEIVLLPEVSIRLVHKLLRTNRAKLVYRILPLNYPSQWALNRLSTLTLDPINRKPPVTLGSKLEGPTTPKLPL